MRLKNFGVQRTRFRRPAIATMTKEASQLRDSQIDTLVLNEVTAAQNEKPSLQVLIVDADPKIVANVAAVVLSEGHRANQCHDLTLGLKMTEILRPQLILIDAALICRIGTEIYRKLRTTLVGASATIVAMGWGLDQQIALEKLDFDYRLNNPISPMLLREILDAAVSGQRI